MGRKVLIFHSFLSRRLNISPLVQLAVIPVVLEKKRRDSMNVTATGVYKADTIITYTDNPNRTNQDDKEKNTVRKDQLDLSQYSDCISRKNYMIDGIKKFYRRESSQEELEIVFCNYIDLCTSKLGKTASQTEKEQELLNVYRGFCLRTTDSARYINNMEGYEVAKKDGFDRKTMNKDFVYYNADYYYMWEYAQRLAGECIERIAEQFGLEEFEKEKALSNETFIACSDYNTLWSCSDYSEMINKDAVPPKGFCLFYREKIIYGERQGSEDICCNTMIVNGQRINYENKIIRQNKDDRLGNYPKKNRYQHIGLNAYNYFCEQTSEGNDETYGFGFLKNFILYSKSAIFKDNLPVINNVSYNYKSYYYRSQMDSYAELLNKKN